MLRALGIFGLGILFILISPALRVSLVEDAQSVQQKIVANSPWSYVAIGVAIVLGLMFCLYRASQPRC
jgi:hypothetical protein